MPSRARIRSFQPLHRVALRDRFRDRSRADAESRGRQMREMVRERLVFGARPRARRSRRRSRCRRDVRLCAGLASRVRRERTARWSACPCRASAVECADRAIIGQHDRKSRRASRSTRASLRRSLPRRRLPRRHVASARHPIATSIASIDGLSSLCAAPRHSCLALASAACRPRRRPRRCARRVRGGPRLRA